MPLDPVPYSSEIDRIIKLPRRVWSDDAATELAKRLDRYLLTPAGRAKGLGLFPDQAIGLAEAFELRGLFAVMAVGAGKTLLTWLIPYLLKAARPILLIPANMRDDTWQKFNALQKDWVSPRPIPQVISYTELSMPANELLLWEVKPTLIIGDEVDTLRNTDTAAYNRIDRYIEEFPETSFVGLTGTMLRKGLRDVEHIAWWCLREKSPYPHGWKHLEAVCNAIDDKVDFMKRRPPGALLKLANDADRKSCKGSSDTHLAQAAFARRVRETPGIIVTDDQTCEQPINIRLIQAPDDPVLDEDFKTLRLKERTPPPDSWELTDPLSVRAVGCWLGSGYYSMWDPRPPEDWLQARKEWNIFCRDQIGTVSKSGRYLDTEFQVAAAFKDCWQLQEWRRIEPTFIPNSVPVWRSASVLHYAAQWLKQNGPAALMCPQVPFCTALAKMTGVKFYGAGGVTELGESVTQHNRKESMILSFGANKRGRNLQYLNRCLIVAPPQPATDIEQALGRFHRTGQLQPVWIDVLIACAENMHALNMAYRESAYVQRQQSQIYKLLIANIDSSNLTKFQGYRWQAGNLRTDMALAS